MSAGESRWSDLAVRVVSGVILAGAGLGAVSAGGWVFITFVSALTGVIVWELAHMLMPSPPFPALAMGALSAASAYVAVWGPPATVLPILLVPIVVGAVFFRRDRRVFLPFLMVILLSSFGMSSVRNEFGFQWMLWLILVVAATDIAGYFAGRTLGGPKIWPRFSPKKTWSGTAAGWVAAFIVGLVFMRVTGAGAWLLALSVAASLASQIGDMAQSAVKRRVGVKDSSQLLPGHGGLFDRFDGLIGATVLVLAIMEATGYPPGPT